MASKDLVALTEATTWAPTDLFYATVGGNSRKIQFSNLMIREAADILAIRDGTDPQTLRIYNTFTDASNYERLDIFWSSNVVTIQPTAAGTGTVRTLRLKSGGGNVDFSNFLFLVNNDSSLSGHVTVGGLLRTTIGAELTIASGIITVGSSYIRVDTEADAASDDLDTISGGSNGDRLVLRASDSGRSVVVKDNTGNIQCAGDCTLDNIQDTIELIYDAAQAAWLEIGRSDNGA